jgi:hypothetical protein
MNVLDVIAGLTKSGQIPAAIADEAGSFYRTWIDQGVAEDVAALALAEAIRVAARTRRDHVEFCINHPDRIPAVADAMREQWREARAGRRAH